MCKTHVLSVPAAKAPFEKTTVERRQLQLDNVSIDIKFSGFSLILSRRSIAGSLVGRLPETQEMLNFAAAHGITPQIEVIGADQVDEAYERILRSDVRYRFVIDISTL